MENTNTSIVRIEIDGIEFNAKKGSKIIEIADEVGIYIPRFCYHKNLSIAANCRMCLVEIEKAPKLFPACATPITDGMKIFTNTKKVIDAQKSIMEFLLINHPLDCPICDQGGECELQDLTVGYGCASSRFVEKKRSFKDYDLGPLVSTDVTRCILCSRCVRFCEEIAGTEELGIIGRGSDSRIFTFLKSHLKSEISGNIIDLCPVGALTAKPSKFKFRPWELVQNASISFHDCIGSNLYVHIFKEKVIRVVPKRNESLNETWISDRDRFSYEGLYSEDRLKNPIIKDGTDWKQSSWKEALNFIKTNLTKIKNEYGANEIAAIASPNSTTEEFYILQKFLRSLGSNNLDHRLNQIDFSNQDKFPINPGLNIEIENIEKNEMVFLIGSNITKEQPIIGIKLRKLINNGGKVFILNPIDFDFSIKITEKYITHPKNFLEIILQIFKSYIIESKNEIKNFEFLEKIKEDNEKYKNLALTLKDSKKKLILLGSYITSSPDYSKIIAISNELANLTNSNFGVLSEGANSSGGWLTGFIPHRLPGGKNIDKIEGLNINEALSKKLKSYILFGTELEFDSIYSSKYIEAIKNSKFTVAFNAFKNENLLKFTNVILPIKTAYENSGSFINISGFLQTFNSIISVNDDIKNGWLAIKELANQFELPGFNFKNEQEILDEFKNINKNKIEKTNWFKMPLNDLKSSIKDEIIIIYENNHFKIDSLTRRAKSLQKTIQEQEKKIMCNSKTYTKIKEKQIKDFCIVIDNNIADNCIIVNKQDISFEENLQYTSFFNLIK